MYSDLCCSHTLHEVYTSPTKGEGRGYHRKGWHRKLISYIIMNIKKIMIIMLGKLGIGVIQHGNLNGGRRARHRTRRGRAEVSIVGDLIWKGGSYSIT